MRGPWDRPLVRLTVEELWDRVLPEAPPELLPYLLKLQEKMDQQALVLDRLSWESNPDRMGG